MSDALAHALLLWLAAHVAVACIWPARHWPRARRALLLVPLGLALLATPWLQPRDPLGPFFLVAAPCLILVLKVRDFHVGAAWYREQSLVTWLRYLPMPFVLVLRRHVEEPRRPRAQNVRLLLRGAAEIALGLWLLDAAREWNLTAVSPWLDHFVRLLAAYLFAFDGGMVFITE